MWSLAYTAESLEEVGGPVDGLCPLAHTDRHPVRNRSYGAVALSFRVAESNAAEQVRGLGLEALGAAWWAALISIASVPAFFVLVALLPVWEWRRPKSYRLVPSVLFRLAIIVGMVTAAARAPVKYMDRHLIDPLPASKATLGQLHAMVWAQRGPYITYPEQARERVVILPSVPVTLRQLADSVSDQTGLDYHVDYCGNASSSIFWGLESIMGIRFVERDGRALAR